MKNTVFVLFLLGGLVAAPNVLWLMYSTVRVTNESSALLRDVALRVDDQGFAGLLTPDEVCVLREVGIGDLSKEHRGDTRNQPGGSESSPAKIVRHRNPLQCARPSHQRGRKTTASCLVSMQREKTSDANHSRFSRSKATAATR